MSPLRDYEELDEDDFYGQGFEKDGVVSVWVGTTDPTTGKGAALPRRFFVHR